VRLTQELYAAFGRGLVWTLRDGKVAGWQIYEDTAREVAAHSA
jgi:hypothetical protein